MNRQYVLSLLLLGVAGCSGPPLKELPVLEPPPPLATSHPKEIEGAPPIPPVAASLPAAPAPRIPGAWRSCEMAGPGSAMYRAIDFLFDEEGAYLGAGIGPATPVVISGTYTIRGGELVLEGRDGRTRVWSWSFDGDRLRLQNGAACLVLERIH